MKNILISIFIYTVLTVSTVFAQTTTISLYAPWTVDCTEGGPYIATAYVPNTQQYLGVAVVNQFGYATVVTDDVPPPFINDVWFDVDGKRGVSGFLYHQVVVSGTTNNFTLPTYSGCPF